MTEFGKTKDEFIASEVRIWGQDYVYDLIDRGYDAIQVIDDTGRTKFIWVKRVLQDASKYAMV